METEVCHFYKNVLLDDYGSLCVHLSVLAATVKFNTGCLLMKYQPTWKFTFERDINNICHQQSLIKCDKPNKYVF